MNISKGKEREKVGTRTARSNQVIRGTEGMHGGEEIRKKAGNEREDEDKQIKSKKGREVRRE